MTLGRGAGLQCLGAEKEADFYTTLKPNFKYLAIFFNHSNLAGWLTTHFSEVCQTQNTYLFLLYTDFKVFTNGT